MTLRVACVNCGEFYKFDSGEILEFIKQRADLKYLKKIPCPSSMKSKYSDRYKYHIALLAGYCPYCREVKFGLPGNADLPTGDLSTHKYLKILTREINRMSGMENRKIPDTYIGFIDDED